MRVAASPPFALFHLQIFGRLLAPVRHDFVVDFLPLVERAQSCPFHCRNVNEHVPSAATCWLNEAIALGRIEPLHSSTSHVASPACSRTGRTVFVQRIHEQGASRAQRRASSAPSGSSAST